LASKLVKAVETLGIMGAQAHLAEKGIKVSRPTLGKLAKGAGVHLNRGRRAA
jgi:hypothetical protein